MVTKNSPTRYQQIVNILEARIVSGLYQVGATMPTEAELCAEFSVSRHTVREALRVLVNRGLVLRRQGSGTIVASAKTQPSYTLSLKSLSEMFQYALDTHLQLIGISEKVLDAKTAAAVKGKIGSRWTVLTSLRAARAGERPFSYVQSCIPPRLAWLAPELPNCVGPFYAHIEKRVNEPVINAEQEISALAMPDEIASALGCDPGTISLMLLRRYMSAQGTIIASFNWHIGADFTYRMALQRESR